MGRIIQGLWRKISSSEFIRFVIVGVINTFIGFIFYYLLLQIFPYLAAYSIMYILGIALSYLLNSFFVFQNEIRFSKLIQFPLVYLAQYIVGIITLKIIVDILKMNKLVAVVITILVALPITFFLSKKIIKT